MKRKPILALLLLFLLVFQLCPVGLAASSVGVYTGKLGDRGELDWSVTKKGDLTVSGLQDPGDKVIVAGYDDAGKFLGAKLVTAQQPTARFASQVYRSEFFWLGETLAPKCEAVSAVTDIINGNETLSSEEVAVFCSPAVFYVEARSFNGSLAWSGSGFFISPDGYAVTNFHVAANTDHLSVTMPDGTVYQDVALIDGDEANDLALLKVSGSAAFPYLELDGASQVRQGQKVYAIGSPKGLDNTMSQGIVSNPNRVLSGQPYIQISVPIDHGSSGGALINEQGNVIGVTCGGFETTADLNLAIPSRFIQGLDKSAGAKPILWAGAYYPGFRYALDFGAFSGVELISSTRDPLEYQAVYNARDFVIFSGADGNSHQKTMSYYDQALVAGGLSKSTVSGQTVYQNQEETVTVAETSDTITITATRKGPQYYSQIPKLPDFGWFIHMTPQKTESSGGTFKYQYNWANCFDVSDDFIEELNAYCALVERQGFAQKSSSSSNVVVFEGNGLSVKLTLSGDLLLIEVAPKPAAVPANSGMKKLIEYINANGVDDGYGNKCIIKSATSSDVTADAIICYNKSTELLEMMFTAHSGSLDVSVSLDVDVTTAKANGDYFGLIFENGAVVASCRAPITMSTFTASTQLNFSIIDNAAGLTPSLLTEVCCSLAQKAPSYWADLIKPSEATISDVGFTRYVVAPTVSGPKKIANYIQSNGKLNSSGERYIDSVSSYNGNTIYSQIANNTSKGKLELGYTFGDSTLELAAFLDVDVSTGKAAGNIMVMGAVNSGNTIVYILEAPINIATYTSSADLNFTVTGNATSMSSYDLKEGAKTTAQAAIATWQKLLAGKGLSIYDLGFKSLSSSTYSASLSAAGEDAAELDALLSAYDEAVSAEDTQGNAVVDPEQLKLCQERVSGLDRTDRAEPAAAETPAEAGEDGALAALLDAVLTR